MLPLVCLAAIFWRSSDRMAQLVARAALVVFVVICLVGGVVVMVTQLGADE